MGEFENRLHGSSTINTAEIGKSFKYFATAEPIIKQPDARERGRARLNRLLLEIEGTREKSAR